MTKGMTEIEIEETEMLGELPGWFKLDNAATVYPAARRRAWCSVYRFSFIFKEDIEPEILKQALKDIAPRFPSYMVQIKNGLFWYYLKRVDNLDVIEEEDYYPCRYIQIGNSTKPLFRVLYYKKRLAVEVFHSVADGGASLLFIKTLAARYLTLKGVKITNNGEFVDIDEEPKKYELEDSFQKNYVKQKGVSRKEDTAYCYKPPVIKNYFKVIHGIVPVEDLKTVSKSMNMTITEFLMVTYLYSFYVNAPSPVKKPIKISIPVSLRPRFDSKTLRNFSLFTNVGFNPKGRTDITFNEIYSMVKGKMEEGLQTDELQKVLSKNVSDASNPFVRYAPNVLKRQVLKFAFDHMGENKFTSAMTNLGIVKLPAEMQEHIERAECLLGVSPTKKLLCAIISYNGFINISFTSDSKKTDVQKTFFRVLSEKGVRVRVESNDGEDGEE